MAAIDPENLNGVLVDARDTMKEIELAAASIAQSERLGLRDDGSAEPNSRRF